MPRRNIALNVMDPNGLSFGCCGSLANTSDVLTNTRRDHHQLDTPRLVGPLAKLCFALSHSFFSAVNVSTHCWSSRSMNVGGARP